MILEYQSTSPDALYVLNTTTPANLQGGSDFDLTLSSPVLTAPIASGHLRSARVGSAELEFPETNTFTMSFITKTNGEVISFGGYVVSTYDDLVVTYQDEELGRFPIETGKTKLFVVSLSPEFITVTTDGEGLNLEAPEEVLVDTATLLADGGILDMVTFWNQRVHPSVTIRLIDWFMDAAEDSEDFTLMHTSELFLPERTEVVYEGGFFPTSEEANSWMVYFESGTTVIVNDDLMASGEHITDPVEMVSIDGGAAVFSEFADAMILVNSLVDISVEAVGMEEPHPVMRAQGAGTRGTTVLTKKEDANDLKSITFWMDPFEGEIMDGVSMAAGVVTGASYINGASYSGQVLADRFMLTVNANFGPEVEIYAPFTYLYTSAATLSAGTAQGLFNSLFTKTVISPPADSIGIEDDDVFIIDSTWGIVGSG